jgi:allophanate hydrolase subunit 2
MSSLTVISHGIVTLQDRGRSLAEYGVPVSGPLDGVSFGLALDLLGNSTNVAFEVLSGAIKVRADVDTLIVVTGGGKAYVTSQGLVESFSAGTAFAVSAGDQVTVDREVHAHGPIYFAVAGLAPEMVLGSVSFDTFSGLGTAIAVGSVFPVNAEVARDSHRNPGAFISVPVDRQPHLIRYVPGPHLPANVLERSWDVTSKSRSGTRLRTGPGLDVSLFGASLPSLPVTPGTVQVTPSGEAIILGPDSGVTGGYPVAGVVISADLHLVSHFNVGGTLRFVPVSVDVARAASQDMNKRLSRAVIHPDIIGAW